MTLFKIRKVSDIMTSKFQPHYLPEKKKCINKKLIAEFQEEFELADTSKPKDINLA